MLINLQLLPLLHFQFSLVYILAMERLQMEMFIKVTLNSKDLVNKMTTTTSFATQYTAPRPHSQFLIHVAQL